MHKGIMAAREARAQEKIKRATQELAERLGMTLESSKPVRARDVRTAAMLQSEAVAALLGGLLQGFKQQPKTAAPNLGELHIRLEHVAAQLAPLVGLGAFDVGELHSAEELVGLLEAMVEPVRELATPLLVIGLDTVVQPGQMLEAADVQALAALDSKLGRLQPKPKPAGKGKPK